MKMNVGQTGCCVDPLENKLRDCQLKLEASITVLRSQNMVNRELIASDLEAIQDMIEEAITISKEH